LLDLWDDWLEMAGNVSPARIESGYCRWVNQVNRPLFERLNV